MQEMDKKKIYQQPKLHCYGSLEQYTLGGSQSGKERTGRGKV